MNRGVGKGEGGWLDEFVRGRGWIGEGEGEEVGWCEYARTCASA